MRTCMRSQWGRRRKTVIQRNYSHSYSWNVRKEAASGGCAREGANTLVQQLWMDCNSFIFKAPTIQMCLHISAIAASIAYVGRCNLLIGFRCPSKLKRAETPSDARTPEKPHFKVCIQMFRPSELVHPSQSTMILTTRLLASRGKSVSRVWIYVGSDSFQQISSTGKREKKNQV